MEKRGKLKLIIEGEQCKLKTRIVLISVYFCTGFFLSQKYYGPIFELTFFYFFNVFRGILVIRAWITTILRPVYVLGLL